MKNVPSHGREKKAADLIFSNVCYMLMISFLIYSLYSFFYQLGVILFEHDVSP